MLLPVGDGGEGTVAAIKNSLGLEEHTSLTGPLVMRFKCPDFPKGQLALFEVADLIGLAKIPIENQEISRDSNKELVS